MDRIGKEAGPRRWQASDLPPKPWHGPLGKLARSFHYARVLHNTGYTVLHCYMFLGHFRGPYLTKFVYWYI
jgi:hypothetical protein